MHQLTKAQIEGLSRAIDVAQAEGWDTVECDLTVIITMYDLIQVFASLMQMNNALAIQATLLFVAAQDAGLTKTKQ